LALSADIPADFTEIAEGLGFGVYSSEA